MISNQDALSANKRALLKIRELKQLLAEKEQETFEPIAVVSMACRFPRSAATPEKFWQQLVSRQEVSREVPASRWDPQAFFDEDPDAPGKMYTQQGVYLDDIDQMDPEFFGISPREATWVDPQQRLLMEVSWEALERAGWVPEKIGDNTGVFIGWMHNDYQNEASDSFLNLNPYIATGAAGSFLCGRLAYYLGLHGPALAVDTACSSSLVALHLGIQSLQRKESDQALVGGVNVICSPTTNILTCKLKALSPQGHSRAFDAAADGYLRGEGCGVIALKRLTDAERDGDPILGIIRGSAVGHNGFSSGLTAPNPRAQEAVIRQALQRAGIEPAQVDYLEAHGTGTELGDPLEVQAAAAALCPDRSPDHPLLIGSVKTNIGHLEAAAGMAGLIKVLLAFQYHKIPGQLHFENPNPHIPWDRFPLRVLTDTTEWPSPDQQIAGVSAFGMSGTNAHVVLESPRPRAATVAFSQTEEATPRLLTISARNEESLDHLAEQYADRLQSATSEEFPAICQATQLARSHFEQRAAIVASDPRTAAESLRRLARRQPDEVTVVGQIEKRFKLAWQFTGQGSQYPGMARRLYETEPVFRNAIDQCQQWLAEYREDSLIDVLFHDAERIHDTLWTQPGLFAVQMGLAQLMEHWGIRPDVVLGHSVGQYAAACVAGVLSWRDGLRLISERGRLIASLPRSGRMLAVFAGREVVEELVRDREGVDIGAYNVSHIVISGQEAAIDEIEQELTSKGIRSRSLQTSHAFHSLLMDPILDRFAEFAESFEFHASEFPLVCNQSGQMLPADFAWSGRYWADHIRGAVRYEDSLRTIVDAGCQGVVELGPRPVLTTMGQASQAGQRPLWVSTLDGKLDDQQALLKSVATLHVHGVTPKFERLGPPVAKLAIDLPTYPFHRRRFWGPDKPRAAHAEHHTAHPLLGSRLALANIGNELRFENFFDVDSPSWLPDHQVMGATVMPGSAFVELALEAARQTGKSLELVNLKFEQPLSLSARTGFQTVVKPPANATPPDSPGNFLESYSQPDPEAAWVRHLVVQSCREVDAARPEPVDLEAWQAECGTPVDLDDFYDFLESIDLNYGQRFRTIESLWQSDRGVLSHLVERADLQGYTVSPTLLDGAFHSLAVAISRDGDEMFLPVGLGRVRLHAPVVDEVWCHAEWLEKEGNLRTANLRLVSDQGEVLLEIDELQVQRIDRSSIRQATRSGGNPILYDFQWRRSRLPGKRQEDRNLWLVAASEDARQRMADLATELESRGHRCQTIDWRESELRLDRRHPESSPGSVELQPGTDPDWARVRQQLSAVGKSDVPDGVIWLLEEQEPTGPRTRTTEAHTRGLVSLIQWLRQASVRQLDSGLQLITVNAIAAQDEPSPVDPGQTQFWGLGRVLSAECPEYRCRMIDLDRADSPETAIPLLAEVLLTDNEENQIAIRQQEFRVPRINRLNLEPNQADWLRPDSAVLISGGLGKLGRQAARWLAERGAAQVVLVSRRAPDEETETFLEQIRSAGTAVVVHPADLAVAADVADLMPRFGRDYLPLAGIIHAAGVLDDGLIDNQNWARFEKVLRPKIDAAWNLHQASLEHSLDFFVLYSSVASVLGSPGQANYAMGNGYLDGLAGYRRQQGLPAISLNWGPWTEGMADDEKIKKRLALQGITALTVDAAHAALETSLLADVDQCFVIDVDWRKLKLGADGKTPLVLSELVTGMRRRATGDSQLVAKLKKLAPTAQRELLVTTVQKLFQDVIASETPPEVDRPLIEMGLDSLMAVEFGTGLAEAFGGQFEIGPSLLFDHPTIESIADYLGSLVAGEDPAKASEAKEDQVAQPVEAGASDRAADSGKVRDDVAVIGMSCRFPGAHGLEEYWSNLLAGLDSVREIPADRWDIERFYSAEREPGKMYTREGGFLEDIGDFDPAFFNISEIEACWIDPQHRLLLENSYHALEHSGIATKPLADNNVGVFMGIMGQDYAFLPSLEDRELIERFEGAGLSHSAGVGRISYLLGLEGPSVSVDTASSSSLVAVIQAVRSLQEGNCNLALAGGANAILAPVNSLLMSKAGLLSPDGRCKSFSEQADGFGRGEGCGVVVLKRLSDAQRDGDRILAVIRGGAIGHNGYSGGLTTPSSKAQVRLIESAIQDAGISPRDVQYLEAHGTGTEFGDPIELAAATQVYGKGRSPDQPLIVGSAKANIGHLEAAGGISGLIKAVLALHHGTIPPQIHFDQPSRHIPWSRMPVTVPREAVHWDDSRLEYAAVTALGLAGTNAHVILGAAPQNPVRQEDPGESSASSAPSAKQHVLFVSAKSETALIELLGRYHRLLTPTDSPEPEVDWPSLCYRSGVDRRHFEWRESIVAASADEARSKLEQRIASRREHHSGGNGSPQTAQPKPGHPLDLKLDGKLFWFPGSGDWDVAALRELVEFSTAARQRLNSFEPPWQAAGWASDQSLNEYLSQPGGDARQSDVRRFVVEACLAELWKDWGLEPEIVTGVGCGQLAAACAADVVSWEDGFSIWLHRLKAPEVGWDEFEKQVDSFNFYPPNMSLICSRSGQEIPVHRTLGGSYWREYFEDETVADDWRDHPGVQEAGLLLSFGPEGPGQMNLDHGAVSTGSAVQLACVDNQGGVRDALLASLARLYSAGWNPRFAALGDPRRHQKVPLPVYPFEKRRYWITEIAEHLADSTTEKESRTTTHV